ncbi:M23 family metallopeptidase [Alteromonas portus]|uniref:M23 family metallopeptidase n=1 Tax=Alteromonas portus TaxID=2565549 RepID=A0A4U0ZAU6_9ALTE|nr:M23 family metallopeptidase [Alteromonas portus]TKB02909.1 M23 family metallopeptidase [Alteromonas portus]
MLAFLFISLTFSLSITAKTTGCFDNKRFCFELTPSSSSLFLVSVQRNVELPVALTLYSSVLQDIPTGKGELKPKAHVNAFLDTNDQVPLGVVKKADAFWASMRVKWTVGRVDAIHDNAYTYLSPLQPAGEYRIVQGFNGNFSHSGASRYALDFAAPVGTPILAAREGVVIDTKDDGTKGGPTPKFAKHANYVVVLHSDGTTGEYYHLKYKGVVVTRGQTVKRGQLIGYTGNTGFSSLPHLHFGIYVAKFHGKYVSVPFSLKGSSTKATP